jgi:hypothetical protein
LAQNLVQRGNGLGFELGKILYTDLIIYFPVVVSNKKVS